MELITDNETQLRFVSNTITTVKGQRLLYDKISVHLGLADYWAHDTFTSDKTFNAITDYIENNAIRINLTQQIVAEAMHRDIRYSVLLVQELPTSVVALYDGRIVPTARIMPYDYSSFVVPHI